MRASPLPKRPAGASLVIHPQSDAAVDGADRPRAGGAVEEEVGDQALGNADAEAAAIFEPAVTREIKTRSMRWT